MASLAASALPGLLVQLHQQGFEGWLQLQRGSVKRRFLWQGGEPTRLESSEDADALVERLISRGQATEEARIRYRQQLAQKPGPELAVLVSLKIAGPKDLFAALTAQLREVLLDCVTWETSQVEMQPGEAAARLPKAPIDVLAVATEGVTRCWRPDQVLQTLGGHATHFPVATEALDQLLPRLPDTEAVQELIGAIGEHESAFNLLRRLADPSAYAAVWLLHLCGGISWETSPAGKRENGEAAKDGLPETHLEIVVTGSEEAQAMAAPGDAARSAAADRQVQRAAELRQEIAELHGNLAERDYWQILGIDREASHPQIKKAYLKLAKRLHPDKVSQLGLDDVKIQANELFAVITRAHEVLTDPDELRAYHAQLEGHTSIDANALAQAETLFRKGEIMMRSGAFNDAFEFLDASVQLWPEEADYQAALAWALFKKSPPEDERSVQHFRKALSLEEGVALTHLRFSLVLKATGKSDDAARHAKRARELDPAVKV